MASQRGIMLKGHMVFLFADFLIICHNYIHCQTFLKPVGSLAQKVIKALRQVTFYFYFLFLIYFLMRWFYYVLTILFFNFKLERSFFI